jgi:hypothetical protein
MAGAGACASRMKIADCDKTKRDVRSRPIGMKRKLPDGTFQLEIE